MSKDLNQTFEELLNRYITALEKDYRQRYKKARDKDIVREDLKKEVDLAVSWFGADKHYGELIKVFHLSYDRGEEVGKTLAQIRKTYGEEVSDIRPFRKIINGERVTLYISEEEKALKKLALDDRKLLKFFIRDTAYRVIQKRFSTLFDEDLKGNDSKKAIPEINWTGEKGNKNEFVQLIYALHKAGLINNGKGEITKIVEGLAKIFSVELGANWQSNLSSSIHKAKIGSSPEIFSKIKTAYEIYAKDLEEHKRKTK